MLLRWILAFLVPTAAVLFVLAHATPPTADRLGDNLEQKQDPAVAKQLNDLLAWSIGTSCILLHQQGLVLRNSSLPVTSFPNCG